MGSAFGAGAGADMLQEVLRRKFTEALAQQKLNEDIRQANMQNQIQQQQLGQGQQRIGLEGERVGLEGRRVGLDETQYKEGGPQRAASLAQTTAQTGELLGRPAAAELARNFTGGQNDLNRQNALRIVGAQGANALRVARERPQPLATVNTVDESGNGVTKFVKKQEGASYVKPANATTATRTASAETVNEVGSDIIRKLSDPQFQAVVGPAMGRASTLRDFIGNPPPEFSELAGQIESYSLANMGVHGMRSAQGAEMIKKLLDQRHTPESLAATIRGLNDFSTRFVEHNKPKSGGPAAPAGAKPTAEDLVKKYGGG